MKTKIDTLKSKLTHGVAPAMATPLEEDGYTVNTAVIPDLVHFLLEAGAAGLFVGGTTGEGILLETAERQRLHEATVTAVNGRVPVLLHIGANRIDHALTLARHAAECDADAVAAVTPTFYGMHDDALAAYYHAIATAVPDTPLLLYDIPHMAVNGVSPALFRRLSREIPSLAGVKTSQGNAPIIRQTIDAAASRLLVLAGNERIALGSLALGADGIISGLSTAVPEPFVALTRAFAANDLDAARQEQRRLNQMLDLMPAGARIGAVKRILAERGIPVGTAVPPRPMPADADYWTQMSAYLDT